MPPKTNRTATNQWRKTRQQILHRDRHQTHCPHCGITLNYTTHNQPNSPEIDHIIPHARGGTNHPDNLQTICRTCNRRKGKGQAKTTPKTPPTPRTLPNTHRW